MSFKRILVANLKYLGDILLTTPVLSSLRRGNPESRIIVLLRKQSLEILENNPDIDGMILFDRERIKRLKGIYRLKQEIAFLTQLRALRLDAFLALHSADRLCLWSFFSGSPYRVGPAQQNFSFLLTQKIRVEEESKDYLDYYFDLAEPLGIEGRRRKLTFVIPKNSQAWANSLLESSLKDGNRPLIGLHPGAGAPAKRWPAFYFAQLADRLIKELGSKVLILSSQSEKELASSVIQAMERKALVILTENLKDLAAILEKCHLFIGNDSSPRHLAMAVGTPTITLLGQKDPKIWQIYKEEEGHFTLHKKVPCQPCGKIHCPKNICLQSITVSEVLEKVGEGLKKKFNYSH